jgi:hypothetical protein
MSHSGSVVECGVEKRSSASSRIATYTCDSCGRVATSVRAEKLIHCCKKTIHPSVEIATEILIPKNEFGSDFIAVIHRGRVVDLLLASGRSSVHGYLWGELERVQEYVDRLESTDENREATDIEVKYGNNLSLVRAPDDVPPALSEVSRHGDIQRASCKECEMISINGVPCHESGCPNEHKPSESRGHLKECSGRDYWRYRNWITGRIARLIDDSESTLKTRRRLALNALRKGSIEQLADLFRRLFKRQEDETRKYYDDSVTASGDERVWRVDWLGIAWNAVENEAENPEYSKPDNQPPEFRFRLNGEIMPEIFVRRALVDGEPLGEWQIVVDIDGIGKFTLDDNSQLWRNGVRLRIRSGTASCHKN